MNKTENLFKLPFKPSETLVVLSSQAAFELEHFKLAVGEKIETPN